MAISVLNTDASLSAKTIQTLEGDETITGVKTFSTAPVINAGISFPATQVANAGANVLDDYEEGTWTPVISGAGGTSGQTYASQSGIYVKVGSLVIAPFSVQLSVEGTITGNAQISGLPFAAHGTVGTTSAVGWSSLATNKVAVIAEITAGAQVAVLYGIGVAASGVYTALTSADIDASTIIRGCFAYRVA